MGSFGEVFDVLGQRVVQQGGQVHISAAVNRVVVEGGTAKGLEVQLAPVAGGTYCEKSRRHGLSHQPFYVGAPSSGVCAPPSLGDLTLSAGVVCARFRLG